jgi:hypothetical protein
MYQMGSTRCCHHATPAACATREKYTPRDMAFLHAYIRMGSTRCHRLLLIATRRNIHQGHGIPPCISEWDLRGAAVEIYTWDMAFLHVYMSRMLATTCATKGEIYTQGHGIPPCIYISEWDLHGASLLAACATREKYTPRDMAFLRISEWDLNSAATILPNTCQRRNTLGHASYYIRMGSARCMRLPTACTKGKYTPRDMAFLHVYIRMGSTRCH